MLRKIMPVAASFLLAGAAYGQQAGAPLQPSPVKREVISTIAVPNSNYQVITAMLEVAPGFKAGRHLHPGIVSGHVLEGQFWIAIEGEPEKTLNPGEGLAIPLRAIHNEGALGDKPMKAIVTYVVEKGQPLVQPVQ